MARIRGLRISLVATFALAATAWSTSVARGATLSLRYEGQTGPEINLLVCESTTVEIVLELQEGETFGFGIVFLRGEVLQGDGATVEVTDFFPDDGELSDVNRDRSAIPAGAPFANGQGITLEQYSLNMGPTEVEGPGTFVLDNIVVHAITLGQAAISFDEDLKAPSIFDPAFDRFDLLPVGTADTVGFLSLTQGDGRENAIGPLIVNVVEDIPPVENENENDNTSPENDNTAANDNEDDGGNDNTGSGNGGGGGGGGGLCGLGMLGAGLAILGGLVGLGRSRVSQV